MTQFDQRPLDVRIAALAERQHGVVALAQLRALGLQSSTVRMRARAGRLHRVHRGVYAVGRLTLTVKARRLAAVLACAPHALLSHRTGADARGVLRTASPIIEVTVPRRCGVSVPGVIVHRSTTLVPEDRCQVDGIPCTSVARTLLDLADVVSEHRLCAAIKEVERLRLYDHAEVLGVLARGASRPAAPRLRRALARYEESDRTRTELERLAFALFTAAGLPRPLVNAVIETEAEPLEVDFYWPDRALIVEADSNRWHSSRADFESDRRRDQLLRAVGLTVVRATWRQVERDGATIVAALQAVQ